MLRFIVTRLVLAVVVLLGISLIVFVAMRMVPGGFATAMLGPQGAQQPELVDQLNERYGLNDPLIVQYGVWLKNALRGDFGESLGTHSSISHELMRRAGVTIELALLSTLISVGVGVPLGIIAAVKRGTPTDAGVRGLGLLFLSIPDFVLGTLLIYFVSTRGIPLPVSGYVSLSESVAGNLKAMVLPVLSLGLITTAVVMRVTRASVAEVLNEPYIVTARAKGLSPRDVTRRHVIRGALIPVITIVGINVGFLLSGAVIVEEIFALPGLGRYALQGILQRDYPIAQATVVLGAAMFVMSSFIVDLLYAWVDPRIRYQ
ncbi:MAG: ABC transporter permease [Thermomicrobiales bacterium]|nr:ABC transporter permease [Thermomicrobiales bacterium]